VTSVGHKNKTEQHNLYCHARSYVYLYYIVAWTNGRIILCRYMHTHGRLCVW